MTDPTPPPRLAFTPENVEHLNVVTAGVLKQLKAGFVEMGRALAESVAASRAEPPPELSVRERALLARQNRHTGPRGNPRRHRRH